MLCAGYALDPSVDANNTVQPKSPLSLKAGLLKSVMFILSISVGMLVRWKGQNHQMVSEAMNEDWSSLRISGVFVHVLELLD